MEANNVIESSVKIKSKINNRDNIEVWWGSRYRYLLHSGSVERRMIAGHCQCTSS